MRRTKSSSGVFRVKLRRLECSYNTPIFVLSVQKILLHLSRHQAQLLGITYCESVFRKSLIENVEVFVNIRTERTTLILV